MTLIKVEKENGKSFTLIVNSLCLQVFFCLIVSFPLLPFGTRQNTGPCCGCTPVDQKFLVTNVCFHGSNSQEGFDTSKFFSWIATLLDDARAFLECQWIMDMLDVVIPITARDKHCSNSLFTVLGNSHGKLWNSNNNY